jgi:ketosteroid isomerase-like protein
MAAALSLAACATVSAPAPSAEAVIAVERAFAADAAARGAKAAFLTHAAPHGVMVRRGAVVNARAFVAGWPEDRPGGLVWWPVLAGVSRSGDFGFTTGPAIYGEDAAFTYYFTVWERQPDGAWRWLIDMGAKTAVKPAETQDAPVATVPVSTEAPAPPAAAAAEVRRLDAELAAEAASDYRGAHARRLAADARVFGLEPVPARDAAAVTAALAARPARISMQPLGAGAARSGDLAYTFGRASWSVGGVDGEGPYLRVWQRRPQGWRIVADLISGG